jgi:hypothetical protein
MTITSVITENDTSVDQVVNATIQSHMNFKSACSVYSEITLIEYNIQQRITRQLSSSIYTLIYDYKNKKKRLIT